MTCSKAIRAQPAAVFAALTDLRNAPKAIPSILRIEVLTEGAVKQGTRFRETRKVFGREHTEEMEIVAFDPPRSYAVGCDSCGARYRTEFRLTSEGPGTRVEMIFGVTPLTLFARVMGVLMRPMTKKMVAECFKDLDAIAAHIEATTRPD